MNRDILDANSSYGKAEYSGSWAQVPQILSRIKPPQFSSLEFDITSYGAVADGETDCRQVIAHAMKACSEAGGGRVIVPAGKYLVNGPIHLESNVDLHLEEGSRILFGTNHDDYLPVVLTRWEGTLIYGHSPLIYANNKSNVALTGTGTIDGQAHDTWCEWTGARVHDDKRSILQMNHSGVPLESRLFGKGHYLRPPMVQFFECSNILVEGIKLLDSPFWCVHLVFSKNVTVRDMKFSSLNPNNDGIDVDSCEDVHIHDIVFNNNDDNVVIKSGKDRDGREIARPSKNIVVQDCTFNSYTGIAIGSEMSGGVYNVFAENCEAQSVVKRGVYLKGGTERGGEIAHVRVRNMKFLNSRQEMLALGTDYGSDNGNHPPYFHDIRMESIQATGPCMVGIRLLGQSNMHIDDVVFSDISIDGADCISSIECADNVIMRNVKINGQLQKPSSDNLPPDVFAGSDQVIDLRHGLVSLRGAVSDDDHPFGTLTYEWTVVKGDTQAVTFEDQSALSTIASFAQPGEYTLKLTAIDGELLGSHTVTICVK